MKSATAILLPISLSSHLAGKQRSGKITHSGETKPAHTASARAARSQCRWGLCRLLFKSQCSSKRRVTDLSQSSTSSRPSAGQGPSLENPGERIFTYPRHRRKQVFPSFINSSSTRNWAVSITLGVIVRMRRFEETDSSYPIRKVLGWDSELELKIHPESNCIEGAK